MQGGSLVSPALFSSMGASLGISPFQQALLNFTPGGNGHPTPRSNDGALHFPRHSLVPHARCVALYARRSLWCRARS